MLHLACRLAICFAVLLALELDFGGELHWTREQMVVEGRLVLKAMR